MVEDAFVDPSASVHIIFDGSTVERLEMSRGDDGAFYYRVDTTTMTDGDHSVVATTVDLAAHVGTSMPFVLAVDNVPPEFSCLEGGGNVSGAFTFSGLAEPAFMVTMASLALMTGNASFAGILGILHLGQSSAVLVAALSVLALLIMLLVEGCRVPVDDPNTHLELTMIHEVMVLDHGGVDLAFIQYGSALKMWVLASLVTGLIIPVRTGRPAWDLALGVAGQFAVAVAVGVVESTMARLRLVRVPQLLAAASILAAVALILVVR
jgi:hypothetical protein